MKILHINTYDFGGAANACFRLHQGLLKEQIDSSVLLKAKKYNYPNTEVFIPKPKELSFSERTSNKLKRVLKEFWLYKEKPKPNFLEGQPKDLYPFTFPYAKTDITESEQYKQADIINLHWVADFLDWEGFFEKNTKPIVWTMHDMNPFTGGCHHSLDCQKYSKSCDICPQLKGTINPSYSNKLFKLKQESLANIKNLHIISPSKWLMKSSQKSKLFAELPHYCIPNSLDTQVFKPLDKYFARETLNLPKDRIIITFIAGWGEKLKGYEYIIKAYKIITSKYSNITFCNVGKKQSEDGDIFNIKRVEDERLMPLVYAATDIFVFPSLAENLPNVIMESLTCGTPVIGFNVGGIPDMIKNEENGYLCPEISVQSLRETIEKFLENPEVFDRKKIAKEAKEKYALEVQAQKYIALYQNILNNSK